MPEGSDSKEQLTLRSLLLAVSLQQRDDPIQVSEPQVCTAAGLLRVPGSRVGTGSVQLAAPPRTARAAQTQNVLLVSLFADVLGKRACQTGGLVVQASGDELKSGLRPSPLWLLGCLCAGDSGVPSGSL